MIICIAGKNDISVECLRHAISQVGVKNVLVLPVSDDDGVNDWNYSLISAARKEGIQIVKLKELYDIEELIFFSLQYDRILNPDHFRSDKLFNIHFSLLPEYKGVFTTILPILHGKTYSGVTLHKIDKGIDTGDIIDQVQVPIQNDTTSRGLYFTCMEKGVALFKKNFSKIYRNEAQGFPQSAEGSTYFDKTVLNDSNVSISGKNTAFQIQRMVNAFCFREYQLPAFEACSIRKAEILNSKSQLKPGSIICQDSNKITISTADFDIVLFKDHYSEFLQLIQKNDCSAIKKLLPHIEDINESNKDGKTPLMIAARCCDAENVKLLIENGADINISDKNERKAVDHARLKGRNTDIIQMLEGTDLKTQELSNEKENVHLALKVS